MNGLTVSRCTTSVEELKNENEKKKKKKSIKTNEHYILLLQTNKENSLFN